MRDLLIFSSLIQIFLLVIWIKTHEYQILWIMVIFGLTILIPYAIDRIYTIYRRSPIPNVGDHIKITWFPNNDGYKNVYIGMEGIVERVSLDGGFILKGESRILVVSDRDYAYTHVKK